MSNTKFQLPTSVNRFIATRKEQGDIAAVLLYGSYARGTQHEKSDVDIIFVVDQGFKSELIVHDGLVIEVLESTKRNMFSYWKENWDEDRHWYLWKDVKVVYDRDGEGAEIVKYAQSLVGERLPWPRTKIENRRQVDLAKIEKVQYLSKTDPGTASILLFEFVSELTENWFKIRGRFVPSTKELLTIYSNDCPEYGQLLTDFHLNEADLNTRFCLAKNMLEIAYR